LGEFAAAIAAAYAQDGPAVELGRGVHEGTVHPGAAVRVPLGMLTRHGLIAGATGTGKSRTLQLLAEQLSAAGVPCLVTDVKGDMSGLAAPGEAGSRAAGRAEELGMPWAPTGFPVEFLALGGIGPGVPVRATLSDFGPQLLAKVLGANETQEQSLQLVFHYADTKELGLLDLSDLRALLTFLDSKEGKAELEGIGGLSRATVGVLLRSLVGLELGGGNELRGAAAPRRGPRRKAPDGRGVISCLELAAVQDKPLLFSTTLMWLLAELFETLPDGRSDLPQAQTGLLLPRRTCSSPTATPAFVQSVTRHRAAHPLQGRRGLLYHADAKDIPGDVSPARQSRARSPARVTRGRRQGA
jgi:hypothetical protein